MFVIHDRRVTKKSLKILKGFIYESFDKVKIIETANKDLEHLDDKRKALKKKGLNSRRELEDIEKGQSFISVDDKGLKLVSKGGKGRKG